MMSPPLILTTPSSARQGVEFGDESISLSEKYFEAIASNGGLPVTCARETSGAAVAALVGRCDGLLLTGGDDVQPELYARNLPPRLRSTVRQVDAPRDLFEVLVIKECSRNGNRSSQSARVCKS